MLVFSAGSKSQHVAMFKELYFSPELPYCSVRMKYTNVYLKHSAGGYINVIMSNTVLL